MPLLTKTEAAQRHGLQRRDITSMVSAGLLPEHRIPGRRHPLYDPSDVDAAMAATKQAGPSASVAGTQPAKAGKPKAKPTPNRRQNVVSFEDAVRQS